MEQYYYNHMDKQKQAVYHKILQGIMSLDDEFQVPLLEGEDLYNVFFQLRVDHPEIFWAEFQGLSSKQEDGKYMIEVHVDELYNPVIFNADALEYKRSYN